MSLANMATLLWRYWLHNRGRITVYEIHKQSFQSLFQGQNFEKYCQLADDFLSESFENLLNPSACAKLTDAQNQNHYTVILSSSPEFLVERFARRFNVDSWRGTKYGVKSNHWTELESVFEGKEKARFVRGLSDKYNISLSNTIGYSDSHIDLPFLEAVGTPIAVNPNRTLRQISFSRGWQTL